MSDTNGHDGQKWIPGSTDECPHFPERVEEIYSHAGSLIGGRCRDCGLLYGWGICTGCKVKKRLTLVSTDGDQRYCTHDCRTAYLLAKQGKKPTARKPTRGRK